MSSTTTAYHAAWMVTIAGGAASSLKCGPSVVAGSALGDLGEAGLQFVAFSKSFDAFETLLLHMLGMDDGIIDGLFRFSRPISGWCPPCHESGTGKAGRLVL